MNDKRAFTLIELLAVIVILGVLMTVAVPNIVSTLDKNKKETFLEDAKKLVSAAEYKIRADSKIEWPDEYSVTVLPMKKIGSNELDTSPFDTVYSADKSFVAITKEPVSGSGVSTVYDYVYYVHLVSCDDGVCDGTSDLEYYRGVNLRKANDLSSGSSSRFDLVEKGADVNYNLINNRDEIRTMLSRENINVY